MHGSTKVRFIIRIWLTSLILLFSAGCQQQQQAVALYVDAVTLKETDQNDKAIEKLNAAVKSDERFSLAHSLLGEIYQEIKDYEKSAASYKKAIELNPWSFKNHFNLGWDYLTMEKFALAAKAYSRACELKPDHLGAHINATICYYKIRDYNKALTYGNRAEQIDPSADKIQYLLGDIYAFQKNYDQAIVAYKRALEIDSHNPEIVTSLAVAYIESRRYKPAKELLEFVIQMQPRNNTAYRHLGYCYLQFDELDAVDKAIESYNKAIEIDNKDWRAHNRLGFAYMLSARNKNDEVLRIKAIKQWRLSLAIKPDQPQRETLLKLIDKYFDEGASAVRPDFCP